MKKGKPVSHQKLEQSFFEAIVSLKNPQEAKDYFEDLCTPSELQAMVDRWQVVFELKAGKSYRTIHEETGVSVTTVGRVARCLQMGTGGYEKIFERQKKS